MKLMGRLTFWVMLIIGIALILVPQNNYGARALGTMLLGTMTGYMFGKAEYLEEKLEAKRNG